MKKIFFFDIDNTLLDHQTNQIPDSALQAVSDLKADGHTIVVATGRSFEHARPFLTQIEPHYSITQNGALVMRGAVVLAKTVLPSADLLDLFEVMRENGFSYGINDDEGAHVSSLAEEVLVPMESVELNALTDLNRLQMDAVLQAWLFFHERHDAVLISELLARFAQFDYVRWHETAVDVLPKGINKFVGCQHVMVDAGIDPKYSYAFGDGLNDLEMLQGVHVGIAMGNADPKLKAVANRVAEHISQDGLAKMIADLQMEWRSSI